MMLPKREHFFTPSNFAAASAGVIGTQQKWAVDRTWPIEGIDLVVNGTVSGTALGSLTADNILGVVKRVNVSINDGVQPRSVVDTTGIGLLELAVQEGLNLDRATLASISLAQGATVAANMQFRIVYPINLVHPQVAEPLRTRMLLPVHLHTQDPVVTVDFATTAEMGGSGSLSGLTAEFVLRRRVMSAGYSNDIVSKGGFIAGDLIETPFTVPLGLAGEFRFSIPTPGEYSGLLFRQYLGGAALSRAVVDQTTTFGSETQWRLESGQVVHRNWRWKHLQATNDRSRVANHSTQTYAPNFAGAVAANTSYQPPTSTFIDFMSDETGAVVELGSLLDTNVAANSGLKVEVIGATSSVATNPSVIYVLGRRFYGDLSKYKAAA